LIIININIEVAENEKHILVTQVSQ